MTTASTRFLVISDTHNLEFADNAQLQPQPFRLPLPKADVVLHCGDLTHCGGVPSYEKATKMLGRIDAELKLVIGGNHDLELDKSFWATHLDEGDEVGDHDKALAVMTGPLAADAGITYLKEGMNTFALRNGVRFTIYTSPYSPAFNDWAFGYKHNEDRFNKPASNAIPDYPNVDIIMTHGPPKGILDGCPQGNVGCENLLRALQRARPLMHCFGHIHEGNGAQIIDWAPEPSKISKLESDFPKPTKNSIIHGQQTLTVNAAIMTAKNEPMNAPWIIDLDLPCARDEIYGKAVA